MKKTVLVGLTLLLSLVAVIATPPISFKVMNDAFETNTVDADSDIDSNGNRGINTSSYVNAQVKDGTYQNISEEYVDESEYNEKGFNGTFRSFWKTWNPNRKTSMFFTFTDARTVYQMAFRGITNSGDGWTNTSMGIYNSSGKTGNHNWPTDLLKVSNTYNNIDTTDKWHLFTFSTNITLPIGQYWFTVLYDDYIKIRRSSLLYWGANKSAEAYDTFSNGLEDPFGPIIQIHGATYYYYYWYNHTIQSYQLDWEHQYQDVVTNWDHYKVCLYAYSDTTNENISVQVWDESIGWEDWGVGIWPWSWQINASDSAHWYNFTLSQNVYPNTTIRFKDEIESGDLSQMTLSIDCSVLVGWNVSMYIVNDSFTLSGREPYRVGEGFRMFEGPLLVHCTSGTNFSLRAKGTWGGIGQYLWIGETNNSDDATLLHIWLHTTWSTNNPAGDYDKEFYLFLKIPAGEQPSQEATARVTIYIGGS